jgi:hypothetical protein
MSTVNQFVSLCTLHGSDVFIHRDDSITVCPCLSPEGFRNPVWHLQNPTAAMCDAAGMIPAPGTLLEITIKGFCQPVQSGAVRRLVSEYVLSMFGEIQTDDHIALLPCSWGSTQLNFFDWGQAGEDWIRYNNRKFQVVSTNLIPDPSDGNPRHHWELGLRLVSDYAG